MPNLAKALVASSVLKENDLFGYDNEEELLFIQAIIKTVVFEVFSKALIVHSPVEVQTPAHENCFALEVSLQATNGSAYNLDWEQNAQHLCDLLLVGLKAGMVGAGYDEFKNEHSMAITLHCGSNLVISEF